MNEIVQVRMQNWASIIKARQDSGQTTKDWCSENDVSINSYYYWLRRLRKAALDIHAETEQDKPCFVKVSDQVPVTSSGIALRIRRRNTVIEVSNDASDRILSLLKDAIMPC